MASLRSDMRSEKEWAESDPLLSMIILTMGRHSSHEQDQRREGLHGIPMV